MILSRDIAPYREALAGFRKTCRGSFKVYDIHGEPENGRQLAGMNSPKKLPVVVAMGTPALDAAVKYLPNVPILFSMAYSIPKEIGTPGGITGVFMDIPLEKYLVLVKKALPEIRRIGIVMNPLYFNEGVEDMRVAAQLLEITIQAQKAGTLRDVLYAIDTLSQKNEILILQPDPLFATDLVFEYALKQCASRSIPITGISEDQVKHGALLGLAADYEAIGVQTGRLCNQILKGDSPWSLAIAGPSQYVTLFNLRMAGNLGIRLRSEILEGKERVF